MAARVISDWSVHAATVPSWPVLLACLAAIAFSVLEVRSLWRRHPRRHRLLLALFAARALAFCLLFGTLFEFSLRVPDPLAQQRRVAVLVDGSASMSVAEQASGPTRLERAAKVWEASDSARSAWAELGLRPEVLKFGETLEAAALAAGAPEFPTLASDEASDLFGALSSLDVQASQRTAPLAAIVVMSDGRVARDDATRAQLLDHAAANDLPIHTVFTASPQLKDAAVGPIAAGEFAFVENLTSFEAELFTYGLEGTRLEVQLLRDGEVIASDTLLADTQTRRRIGFEIAPERTGQFVYEVAVVPVEGEANLVNNRRPFVLKVLRDKIRVLHVAGRPDWDVRALRTLLRRDPNVELLSYYILRDEEDSLRSDDSAPMSLIAFPTQELFHEQLGSFDLIVLHNFDPLTHGNYLDNLARYVEQGGSLVVIGGDLGLAGGDFARSPLEALLPLDLRAPLSMETEPFTPKLTEQGRRHPITAWIAEGQGAGWDSLPALDSFNRGELNRDARLGAIALLEGPGGAPLLSVAEPGRGRSLILSTGATWRLGFAPDLPLIDGARPYDLLWLGIVRWVLRDAAAERLRVQTDRSAYTPSQEIEVSARTLSASYQAEPDVELTWELRPLPNPDNKTSAAGTWTTDALGRASQKLAPLPAGPYELEVWRSDGAAAPAGTPPPSADGAKVRASDRARRVFVVGSRSDELADLDALPGRALLQSLAQQGGGTFLDASEGVTSVPEDLQVAQDTRGAVARTRELPLWNGWLALAALLLTLPFEWYLRRRLGFV